MSKYIQTPLTACALLLAVVLVLANAAAAIHGMDNIRMIQTFSLDEGIAITRMRDNLKLFSLDPDGFFYYGNLYHSIAYYCLAFLERFGWTITTSLAGFVLRLLSVLSGALVWLSMWKLGKICNLPSAVAAAAALAMLTMPDFVIFSRTMHPDVLQAFFVIVGLGAALVRPTFPFALISAAGAGLAFSTKYIGAVVLPFGFLPLALSTLASEPISRQVLRQLFLQGLAMVGAFLGVFVLTNPYALFDHAAFIDRFIWQMKYSSNGYGTVGSTNPLLWLDPLRTQFGTVGVVYLLGGFLLACVLLLRDLRLAGWRESLGRDDLRTRLVLTLYALATSLHLAISIHQREARFLYHVIPFLLVLSTSAILGLVIGLTKGFVRPRWTIAAVAASLLVFAMSQIGFDLRAMAEATRRSEAAPIKFGDFIASHYPVDTKILADSYTYLPPSMTNVTYTDLQTENLLGEVAPELIVINHGATGSSVWKKAGTSFSEGKFDVDRSYAAAAQAEPYLNKLASPSLGWSVVRESDFEVLLQRNKQ